MLQKIKVKTKENEINIDIFYDIIDKQDIVTNKSIFNSMCKTGCINYNNKYCCPPFSPDFNNYTKNYSKLLLIVFLIDLEQFKNSKYKDYHKLRLSNVIIKSRLERLMRNLETQFNTTFLGTGACRLCKPCKKKLNLPCKYPFKMRYSLESTGVDCSKLLKKLFDLDLLWYDKKNPLKHTLVMAGLLLKDEIDINYLNGLMIKELNIIN